MKKTPVPSKEGAASCVPLSETLLNRMGFLLKKSAIKMQEFYEEALRPLGIIGKHAGVLTVLQDRGVISQQEIGKCIYMDRTSMVAVIDDLERRGLVERKAHPTDRRSHVIVLTSKGMGVLPRIRRLSAAVEKKFLSCLSPGEQKDLQGLLRKLVITHYAEPKETR